MNGLCPTTRNVSDLTTRRKVALPERHLKENVPRVRLLTVEVNREGGPGQRELPGENNWKAGREYTRENKETKKWSAPTFKRRRNRDGEWER